MAWNYFSKDHRCMEPSGPCAYPHAMAKCYATGSKKTGLISKLVK